jgi:opacity protein-like surface antigen
VASNGAATNPGNGSAAERTDAPARQDAQPRADRHREEPIDARHRLEVRVGGWGDGWYERHGDSWEDHSGSGRGAFGVEYLSFLSRDFAIGVGFSSLVRADDCGECLATDTARVVTIVPVTARWYPARRLTRSRAVEPFITGGIGPVFGVDTIHTHDQDSTDGCGDDVESTKVGTAFGTRVGAGVDFRITTRFTLGVAGAWSWDSGFSSDLWRAPRPKGGEFTVTFGWNFGR